MVVHHILTQNQQKDKKPVRLAIVGCGAVTEIGHLPALQQIPEIDLVGLIDTNIANATKLAKRFGVPKTFSSLDEIEFGIDGVILATPPDVRPLLAEQAFHAGLHVLCEKPLANTSLECKIIMKSSEDAKRVLSVAHTYRYSPNREYVYSLLQEEELGSVYSIEIEEGDPTSWPTYTGYTFRKDMVPGGVLHNLGIHTLDTLFWWFGYPKKFEYEDDSIGGLESNLKIKTTHENGVVGDIRMSRTCSLKNHIIIKGERGELSIPIYNPNKITQTIDGKETIKIIGQKDLGFVDLVTAEIRDFIDSIQQERQPSVTGNDGFVVIEFIEKCYAAKRNRPPPERAPIPGLTW
jgi:predicted dehydrogenase